MCMCFYQWEKNKPLILQCKKRDKSLKTLTGIFALFTSLHCLGQSMPSTQLSEAIKTDTVSPNVIFFDDFNNNNNNWTVARNKNVNASIDNGLYYLTALRHAYGETQEIKIDTHKDFSIEARIKIVSGNAEHKNYYSMLFWGREAMNSYYFTFAKDGFASVEICSSKKQRDCNVKPGSLQKTTLNPDEFNVYTIKKIGNTYSFLINGITFYEMPFTPFFGNLIGFGAEK